MSANTQPQQLPRYQDMGLFDESFYQVNEPSRPVSTVVPTHPARISRNTDSISTDSALQSSSAASSDYRLPTSLYEIREQSQTLAPAFAAAPAITSHSRNFFDSAAAGVSPNPHDSVFGGMTAAEIDEVDRAYGLESLLQLVEMGFPAKHSRIALEATNGNVARAITFCIEHDAEQIEHYILAGARGEFVSPPEPVTVISSTSPNALPPAIAVSGKAKGGMSGLLRTMFKKTGSQQPSLPAAAAAAQQQQQPTRAAPPPAAIAAPPPSSAAAAPDTFRIPATNPSFVAGSSNARTAPVPSHRRSAGTDALTTVQEPEWEDFHLFPELANPPLSSTAQANSGSGNDDSSAVTVTSAAVAAPSVIVTVPPPVHRYPFQQQGLESSSSEYGSLMGASLSVSTAANESVSNNTPHVSIARGSVDTNHAASFMLMDSPVLTGGKGERNAMDDSFAASLMSPPGTQQAVTDLAEDDDQAVAIATIIEESDDEIEAEGPAAERSGGEESNTVHSTSFIIEGEATIVSADVALPPTTATTQKEAEAPQLLAFSNDDGNEGNSFAEFASPDVPWSPPSRGIAVDASFDASIFGSHDPFVSSVPPPPASVNQHDDHELPQVPTMPLSMPVAEVTAAPPPADESADEVEENSFNDDTNSSITSFTAMVTAPATAPPRPASTNALTALSEEQGAFVHDGHISIHPNNIITDFTVRATPFPRRNLNAYFIDQLPNGIFRAIVVLKQPKLKPNESSPQGSRADQIILSDCHSQQMAQELCEIFSPPIWAGKHDEKDCSLCKTKFSMFNAPHHCRNCGHLVCNSCSDKLWPGHMLPRTYHNNEKIVRICHSCHFLSENFIVALREGDFNKAQSIYASGNINLHQPYAAYMASAHAVHLAAAGGNLDLLKWLIDNKRCPIVEKKTKQPVVTQSGLSVLAIAAQAGHSEIVRYLVHEKGCVVTEIQDVLSLQRALHAILKAPGPLPTNEANVKGMYDDLLFPLPSKNAAPASATAAAAAVPSFSSPTANAAWTSATAHEAPVLMLNRSVYAAPAFVNTMGVAASPDLPLNGLTNATLAKQLKYRSLASQAVFMVNEFLETQRRALMYTVPLSAATAVAQPRPTASGAGNVQIGMASAVAAAAVASAADDSDNFDVAIVQAVPARGSAR